MDNIISYFQGERVQCLIGLAISLVFISASIYFLFLQKPFFKGMAFAVLPLSVLLVAICVGVIFRTSGDIERVTAYYQSAPENIQTAEVPRMEKVLRNFSIVKKVELGIFIAGVLLAVFFWNKDLIRGIAFGLILQGIILYLFDHIAELRGKAYMEFLTSLL